MGPLRRHAEPHRFPSRQIRGARGSEQLRFLVAGGWNTLFGYTSFALLYYLFSPAVHYIAIVAVSTVLNITMAYASYKLFVFRTQGNYLREYLRFYPVYAVPIGLSFVLLPLLIEVAGLNAYVAQAVVIAVTVVVSYLGHKHISFQAPR